MSDIKQINGKYYDFGCKNQSFLQTAQELKTLGIKNYYFMLRIDNPRVADIDPFKPNITRQEISLLLHEFQHNVWAFIRMCVRMRTDMGVVPYGLHRGLTAVIWCCERHQDSTICEPRQTWKTTGTIAGPILWAFQLSQNLHIHFFGKETDNSKRNLAHLRSNIELLPEWLQFRRYMGDDGKMKKARQATERLENNLLHNTVEIHPKAASLSHAQGLGRGGSGAVIYFDEIEHTPWMTEIVANSAPLFKTASENAIAAGQPSFRCFSCTPGNLDTREGRDAYPFIKSMIPFTEKLYDMTDDQINEYKSAFREEYHNSEEKHTREVVDIFYIEYQYYQLRKTYAWVQEQFALSGDKMAIRREILLQRLRGSTNSAIDPEDIEYLISNMRHAKSEILLCNKWLFKIYDHGAGLRMGQPKELDEDIPYLVGIDPAGGGGGDNFAVYIVNPWNLQIAAEFKSPYISGPNAVRMLLDLVHDYIPRAVLIPEKNSMGIYLIQMLLETDIRDNLYWSESARQLEEVTEEDGDSDLRSLAASLKKYGTYLSNKVRSAMFELLFQHLAEAKQVLTTEYLVDDLCKLVRTPTGRIEADKGEHDDCVMAYLHAIYIYYTGDNLERFGIIKGENPLFGPLTDEETITNEIDQINSSMAAATIRPKRLSYDEEVMQDSARMESQIEELCNNLSFVHDSVYDNRKLSGPVQSPDTMDLPMSFFDKLNGV